MKPEVESILNAYDRLISEAASDLAACYPEARITSQEIESDSDLRRTEIYGDGEICYVVRIWREEEKIHVTRTAVVIPG